VRDPAAVDGIVAAAVERFGGVDILINNAAGNFRAPAEKLSPNGWNAVVGIVLNGSFYCARAAGLRMIEQGRGGAILNNVVADAWTGGPGTVHSAAAKAGVLAMTRTLAVEWAPYGIRVNAIAPGPVETENAARNLWPTSEEEERLRKRVPLGRFGTVQEIAQAASYLVSDYAGYVTGEVLTIDGGEWLGKGMFEYRKQ
jgi:NAD(P)-dependent dehydrogenase (short-subunit alcohol dehydrogenase family)